MTHPAAYVAGTLIVIWTVAPPPAAAQVTRAIDASVAAGAAYDENVFARPTAQSDHVYRVSPRFELQQNTVRSELRVAGSTDAEWYSRYSVLSTLAARQFAEALWSWRTSSSDTVGLIANYDSSINPSELNRETGLFLGRVRAWRWTGQPTYAHVFTPRTKIEADYRLTGEFAATLPDILTHAGEVALVEQITPRDELRPTYIAEFFQFSETDTPVQRSHRGLLRWTHRVTPSLRVTVGAGARFAEDRTTPELELHADRRAGALLWSVGYDYGRVTTLGVTRLLGVHNAIATLAYSRPKTLDVSIGAGFFRSTLDDRQADVYYGDASIQVPIARPLYLRVSSSIDYQRGRIVPVPGSTFELLTVTPLPVASLPGPVRRSTVFVAFVLAGSTHSASGPGPEPPGDGVLPRGVSR